MIMTFHIESSYFYFVCMNKYEHYNVVKTPMIQENYLCHEVLKETYKRLLVMCSKKQREQFIM